MAFTVEEVTEALITPMKEWPNYHPVNTGFETSANYNIIINYLTGKSNSLSGLQFDEKIYRWVTLLNLLKDIENISANDQLVLDVIHDPLMLQFANYGLNSWIFFYILRKPSEQAFLAAHAQFQKQGMSDDEIFQYIIFRIGFVKDKEADITDTPLERFLIGHIKKSPKLIYPKQNFPGWGDDWSHFYFALLEKVNPLFAKEYAVYSIYSRNNTCVTFFIDYKQGEYLQDILTFLTNEPNKNTRNIQPKFSSAIHLYEYNAEMFTEAVLQLANEYLENFYQGSTMQVWENGAHLKEFEGASKSHFSFSTCAIHLFFKHQREKALEIIDKWKEQNAFIKPEALDMIYYHLKEGALPYFEAAIKTSAPTGGISYYKEVFSFLQQHAEPVHYLSLAWSLTKSKSKAVRELIAKIIFDKDENAETKSISLLENKNAETRQTAALVLSYSSTQQAKDAIMKMIDTETNDNARDILLGTVADILPTKATMEIIADTIEAAKKRNKLNKPVETWLDEDALPSLFYTTGKKLSKEEKRFLLYRMSRIKTMNSDMEAKYILQYLDKEKSAPFALELIKIYKDKGAKPEHKYLMALAALLGDDTVVDKIKSTINNWIDESRYKMAEYGIGALAIQGSDKALRWVEWYSRKYRSKKANVGAAALAALENAAAELGISSHELGDRIVPDFGFDGLFKYFTVDGEEYRAFIDSNFKIAFFNEDNKKLKSIPAAADTALKDEFKAIGKEIRDIVKSQSPRLEYYLIIQRRWSYEQWQKFFLQNPVMFIYATKLVWGVYENDIPVQTFICNEDTSLVNETGDEIEINSDSVIGIVYPTQLDEPLLQQWKQQLFDLSVEQVFPQLERRMPDMKDIDLTKNIIHKYNDKQMATGSIRSTLERYGWHKGPTGDGGMLDSMKLLYFEKKLEAVMEVEGVGAGYGWGFEEKLGRLYIIDKTKDNGRWGYAQNENDGRLVPFKNVPTIFLNEMLAAIEAIKPADKKVGEG